MSEKKNWKATQWNYDEIFSASEDMQCFQLSERDRQIILPAIEAAAWKTRYYSPSGGQIIRDLIEQWQSDLYDRLFRFGDCAEKTDGCEAYKPDTPLITYAPNDPFASPNYVAPGFILPAWYKVTTVPPLSGLKPGDVLTDPSRYVNNPFDLGILPPPFNTVSAFLNAGFPRFRVSWYASGASEVEIHLLAFVGAGFAVITVDGGVSPVSVINLANDITDVPTWLEFVTTGSGLYTEVIHEQKVETGGFHHLDVTMLPYPTTSFPWVNAGGGLRSVVICGEGVQGIMPQPMFRFTETCGLEVSVNEGASYQPVPGWDTYAQTCFKGDPGTNGIDGIDGIDGASTELRMSGTWVQWRQSDNNPTWTNLYDTALLGGVSALDDLKKEKCRRIAAGLIRRFWPAYLRFVTTSSTSSLATYRARFQQGWIMQWDASAGTMPIDDPVDYQREVFPWAAAQTWLDWSQALYDVRAGLPAEWNNYFSGDNPKISAMARIARDLYCYMNDELVLSAEPADFTALVAGWKNDADYPIKRIGEFCDSMAYDMRRFHRWEDFNEQVTDVTYPDCTPEPPPPSDTCEDGLYGFDWCIAHDFVHDGDGGFYQRSTSYPVQYGAGIGWLSDPVDGTQARVDIEAQIIANIGRIEVWRWGNNACVDIDHRDECNSFDLNQIYVIKPGNVYELVTASTNTYGSTWSKVPGCQFYVYGWDHNNSTNDPSAIQSVGVNFRWRCAGINSRLSIQRIVIYGYDAFG